MVEKMDLISVVVPVFNVESYLRICVESIIRQTYKNIEIILVDDGSTDQSGKICDELETKYDKIVVIHKENRGLSDSRNVGIETASGKYICFVDSDDWVDETYIESMKQNMKGETKITSCGYCRYYDSGKIVKINYENIDCFYKNISAQKYLNILGYFNVSACNKLFDKRLFDEIRFPVGKKSEDWYVMYRLIETAGGIYYNSDIKYFYRQREGSITKSTDVNTAAVEAAREVYNYYIEKKWDEVIPFAAQSLAFAIIGVYNAYLCNSGNEFEMKKLRRDIVAIQGNITFKELSKVRKLQLTLFLKCKVLYDIMFRLFDLKRKMCR